VFQQVSCGSPQETGAKALAVRDSQDNNFHLTVFRLQGNGWTGMSSLQVLSMHPTLLFARYNLNPGQDLLTLTVFTNEFSV
jgi:hypothetical protein